MEYGNLLLAGFSSKKRLRRSYETSRIIHDALNYLVGNITTRQGLITYQSPVMIETGVRVVCGLLVKKMGVVLI